MKRSSSSNSISRLKIAGGHVLGNPKSHQKLDKIHEEQQQMAQYDQPYQYQNGAARKEGVPRRNERLSLNDRRNKNVVKDNMM